MQLKYHMVTIENLAPAGHFLRKLEAALDMSFVYEETAHLYSRKYGRLMATDSTHVKANASRASEYLADDRCLLSALEPQENDPVHELTPLGVFCAFFSLPAIQSATWSTGTRWFSSV